MVGRVICVEDERRRWLDDCSCNKLLNVVSGGCFFKVHCNHTQSLHSLALHSTLQPYRLLVFAAVLNRTNRHSDVELVTLVMVLELFWWRVTEMVELQRLSHDYVVA